MLVFHFWNSPAQAPTQEWQKTFSEAEFCSYFYTIQLFRIQFLILNENAGQVHVHLPYFSVLVMVYPPWREIYRILHPYHLTLKQKWEIKHSSDKMLSSLSFPSPFPFLLPNHSRNWSFFADLYLDFVFCFHFYDQPLLAHSSHTLKTIHNTPNTDNKQEKSLFKIRIQNISLTLLKHIIVETSS